MVLRPAHRLPLHCECFLLLCRIVRIMQLGDRACQRAHLLEDLIQQHALLFRQLYPDAVRPKLHYMLHIPATLQRLGVNVSCFVTERKHRETRRAAASIFRHFEKTLTLNGLNRHVQQLQDPLMFQPTRLDKPTRAEWALPCLQDIMPEAVEARSATRAQHTCGLICRGDVALVQRGENAHVGQVLVFLEGTSSTGRVMQYVLLAEYTALFEDQWSTLDATPRLHELSAVKATLVHAPSGGDRICVLLEGIE